MIVRGYVYDAAGRLMDVYQDGVLVTHYDHDENGNRLGRTTLAGTEGGAYDDQDRLTSYAGFTYVYLDGGELLSRMDTVTGATTLYTYDPLGSLRHVSLPGGTEIEYVVDGLGRRVGKEVGGVLVKGWLWGDALRPVAELDGAGAVVARFVYAEGINVPDVMIKGGVTYRIVTDTVGSVRLVVDAAMGVVAQRLDYDEFGRVVLDTSPGFQPFGFAGGLYDPDTGLVRFGARDYDAEIGRWTAKDPLLFDGGDTNLYLYSLGDPLNRADPHGRAAVADYFCFAGGLLLSGGIFGESPDDLVDLCFPGPPMPPRDPEAPDAGLCEEPDDIIESDTPEECQQKYEDCVNYGAKSCQKEEAGKTKCKRCQQRCEAGDSPTASCRKCGF